MKKTAGDVAGGATLSAGDINARLLALRRVACLAMLAGVALSPRLWFPASRTFPRAPLFFAPPQSVAQPFEYILGGLLVAALAAAVFAGRAAKYLLAAIVPLVALVLLDQTRLQPWVYQYLLLFALTALLHDRRGSDGQRAALTLSALQLTVAALYFWSGVQKLNYTFAEEVLPQLLAPVQGRLPLARAQLSGLAVAVALAEIFTGVGLLVKKTRASCVWLAVSIHASALALLVSQGRNSAVWAWNVALAVAVVILFRRGDAPVHRAFAARGAADARARVAQALTVACAVLPALSFWGCWDMYLSGALYSGNTPVAVVRVDGPVYERLPGVARRQVFTTNGGERVLPLFEWAMAELNVPPYPEPRVYRHVAREVCKLDDGEGRAELIVKGRPAILDGSYRVTREGCPQLAR
ncbi:MAG TPA: hypothetical protein VM936_22830 [Pyrinomonadaceae bacterium]|nr:hypothetical protein [Pyrinomonadaceae bacterium]